MMEEDTNVPNDIASDIKVHKISLFKKSIEAPEDHLDGLETQSQNYSFSFAQKNAFNHEDGAIRVRLYIILEAEDENHKKTGVVGDFGIEFQFSIDNMNKYVSEEKDGKKYYTSLLGTTIMAIAYSTSRGIILQETQGTLLSLSGVILPIIDPKKLLVQDS